MPIRSTPCNLCVRVRVLTTVPILDLPPSPVFMTTAIVCSVVVFCLSTVPSFDNDDTQMVFNALEYVSPPFRTHRDFWSLARHKLKLT